MFLLIFQAQTEGQTMNFKKLNSFLKLSYIASNYALNIFAYFEPSSSYKALTCNIRACQGEGELFLFRFLKSHMFKCEIYMYIN